MQRPDDNEVEKLPVSKLKEILAQRGALSFFRLFTISAAVLVLSSSMGMRDWPVVATSPSRLTGVDYSHCVEKSELVALVKQTQNAQPAGSASSAAAPQDPPRPSVRSYANCLYGLSDLWLW
jgi:hypothetical protein